MPWSDRLQTKRLQIEQNNNFLSYKLASIFIPLALAFPSPSLFMPMFQFRLAAMVWLMIRCQGQPDHCHDYCSSCLSITNSAQFGQINIKFDKRCPKSYGIKALKWALALMSEWMAQLESVHQSSWLRGSWILWEQKEFRGGIVVAMAWNRNVLSQVSKVHNYFSFYRLWQSCLVYA